MNVFITELDNIPGLQESYKHLWPIGAVYLTRRRICTFLAGNQIYSLVSLQIGPIVQLSTKILLKNMAVCLDRLCACAMPTAFFSDSGWTIQLYKYIWGWFSSRGWASTILCTARFIKLNSLARIGEESCRHRACTETVQAYCHVLYTGV